MAFVLHVCPTAEVNLAAVQGTPFHSSLETCPPKLEYILGQQNLVSATKFWEMAIMLRPYLFQVSTNTHNTLSSY